MENQEIEVRRYLHHSLPTLRDVAAIVFRHWRAMLIAAAIVIVATIVTGIWTPRYEAHMKILVESRRTDAVVSSSSVTPVQFNGNTVTEEDLNSEVELLKGDDLLRKVVRKTGIVRASVNGTMDEAAVALAARRIGRDLHVEAIRKTHVISVRYSSRDPKRASAVLDALSAAYIAKHAEVHRPSGEFTFFDQEASRFRRNLEQAQNRMAEFSVARHVISAQAERDAALQQANDFDSKAHEAHTLAAETASRIRTLEQQLAALQPRVTTSIRSSDNPQLMGQLKSTLLTLQLKKSELLTKFAPGYPLVQEVERQIAETQSSIQAADRSPLRDETTDRNPSYEVIKDEMTKARAEYSGLIARESAASAIASQYRDTARHRDEDNVIQQNLQRDVAVEQDAYLLYVRKSEEAGISDALDRRGIVNVAVAENPTVPHEPERSPSGSIFLTLALMLFGSFTTAFAIDAVDPTFRAPEELEAYLDAPVLGALPKDRG